MIMDTYTDCFVRPPRHDWPNMERRRNSLLLEALISEEQTGVGAHPANANHYFREKKWEFFPELAPLPMSQLRIPSRTVKARTCREPSSKQPQSVNPNATSISASIQKAFSERTSRFKAVRRYRSREISMLPTIDKRTPAIIEGAPLQHDLTNCIQALYVGGNEIVSCTPMTPHQEERDRREGGQAQRRPTQIVNPKGFTEKPPERSSKGDAKWIRPEEQCDIHINRSTGAAPFFKARARSAIP